MPLPSTSPRPPACFPLRLSTGYAGFFDPGFGHSSAGGTGSRAVLEVRSREVPFLLGHGQTIGRLVYERLAEAPDRLYGSALGSNYQAQTLKLSKHFKPYTG